jgi:hypothetical protein
LSVIAVSEAPSKNKDPMFCIDESSAVEDGEESLEVAMDKG